MPQNVERGMCPGPLKLLVGDKDKGSDHPVLVLGQHLPPNPQGHGPVVPVPLVSAELQVTDYHVTTWLWLKHS